MAMDAEPMSLAEPHDVPWVEILRHVRPELDVADPGSVCAFQVGDGNAVAGDAKNGVPPRHGDVIDDEIRCPGTTNHE